MVVLSSEDRMSDPKDRNWPKDEFGRSEVFGQLWWWVIPIVGPLSLLFLLLTNAIERNNRNQVVAYCAQDQVYAEPIFREFERLTGDKVRALYDNEAVKTVGLA